MYDLQTWMGAPSIYVYDCSNAGIIVDSFKGFAEQHEKEHEVIFVVSFKSLVSVKALLVLKCLLET